MKVKFALAFLVLSSFAHASEIYRFGKLVVAMDKVDGIFVNRNCLDKSCLAYKAYLSSKNKNPSVDDLAGGKNPLAVKCKKIMKGKVLIGLDKNRGEQSFCTFPDDSFLKLN